MKRGLGRAGCLLPELNPRQHMHKHLPARTRKSFGRSAERNLTVLASKMVARKEITLKRQTILACLFCVSMLLPVAEAANQTYGFNLVGPQITSAASGASVRTTGSGSFDPVAQTKPATLSSPGGAFCKKLF